MAKEKREEQTQPKYPFDKMPHQEKDESGEELQEFDIEPGEELDLGLSPTRQRKRTLGDERGAGHEP